jgi:hypothetical protein
LFTDPPASSTHHDVTRPRAGSSKPRDLNERIRKPRVKRAKKEKKARRGRGREGFDFSLALPYSAAANTRRWQPVRAGFWPNDSFLLCK